MKVAILVLNYNGKDLMERFLHSICMAAEASSYECDVHVVDNLSSDGSCEYLRENFPDVKLHVAQENKVLCSYNDVVEKLDSEIVIFLNNDMKVEPDFVDHLVKHFKEKDVMFVAPRLMNFDNTFNGGKSYLEFKNGAIKVAVDAETFMDPGQTQAISTGAFRRGVFVEFGGFDDLYLPGIWEDVDICFRGMTQGWRGVYEPDSIIWHAESTTFHREYGRKKKLRIAHRNMFLFIWKNITDPGMLAIHLILTPPRVIVQLLRGKEEIIGGFFMALKRLPLVLTKRKSLKNEWENRVLPDRSLIS